jgi:hypothetical protein
MYAARLLAMLAAAAVAGCRAAPAAEPENADAYAACQRLMLRNYELWRQIHRPDLAAADFARQVRFVDLAGDSATVRPLGGGVFEVSAYADRPSSTRKGSFRGSFRCRVRQTWTQEGEIFQIG